MKIKKVLLASALTGAGLAALASCNANNPDEDYDDESSIVIWDGYTSLANPNPLPKIDQEGYYTVGDKRIKTKNKK